MVMSFTPAHGRNTNKLAAFSRLNNLLRRSLALRGIVATVMAVEGAKVIFLAMRDFEPIGDGAHDHSIVAVANTCEWRKTKVGKRSIAQAG